MAAAVSQPSGSFVIIPMDPIISTYAANAARISRKVVLQSLEVALQSYIFKPGIGDFIVDDIDSTI